MPRFNFAEDPEEPQRKSAKQRRESGDTGAAENDLASGKRTDAAENAGETGTPPERRLPYTEAVPDAFTQPDTEKYTAPPSQVPPSAPEPEKPKRGEESASGPNPARQTPIPPDKHVPEEPAAPPAAPPQAELPATAGLQDDAAQERDDFENPFDDLGKEEFLTDNAPTPEEEEPPPRRSVLPLVGIAAVVLFLLSVSIIWFFDPIPPLRNTLEGFFFGPEGQPSPKVETPDETGDAAAVADTLDESLHLQRDWNYYLQISAFKELYMAQDDANRLRKLGLNAKVEGEFIPSQRRTYYRVRLGPFESAYAAAMKGDSLEGVIPASAFVDSIRVEADVVDSVHYTEPIQQPVLKKPRRRTASARTPARTPEQTQPPPERVPGAATGYAVAVGAYKSLQTAQQESRSLIGRGLPAYTSKSVQNGTHWYRVLVGPFRTRKEAERYLDIVKKESGGAAYIRSLGE